MSEGFVYSRFSRFVRDSYCSVRRTRPTVHKIIMQTSGQTSSARDLRSAAGEATGGLQHIHSRKPPVTDQSPEHYFRARIEMRLVPRTPERQGDRIEHHQYDGPE